MLILGDGLYEENFESLYGETIENIDGWMSKTECALLYLVSKSVTCAPNDVFVEIGSYEGKSSICIASGMNPGVKLLCVDPHTGDRSQVEKGLKVDTFQNFLKNIKNANLHERIIPIVNLSVQAAIEFEKKNQNISLLFIDGWHSQVAVEQDITMWMKYFQNYQTVIFDDFPDPEVQAGIAAQLDALPPLLGSEGKIVVYSNDPSLRRSKVGKYLWRKSRIKQLISLINHQ